MNNCSKDYIEELYMEEKLIVRLKSDYTMQKKGQSHLTLSI